MRIILSQLTLFPEAGRVDIYEYAKALAVLGNDVHVIVCQKATEEAIPNLTVHELGISTNAGPINSSRFAVMALRRVRQITKKNPVDVIHLFNPAPATFALGWLLKFLPKRPRIVYDIRTGGIGIGFDSRLINGMARKAPLFADGIITLSASLFTVLFGTKKIRHAVIPLGVDTDRYKKHKSSSDSKPFRFVYLGSLSSNRNLNIMLESFEITHKKYPEARLTLIGEGDQRIVLQEMAETKRLTDVITFTGSVPFEQVPSLLAEADCGLAYVPITPWFNPQPPLKTLEYLASGLNVVATKTDSHQELWEDLPCELLQNDTSEDF
ncbi:MAG: glycosyltransferase family 4 protein, partial [Patescibacteria group bacterium]|nr:glycosyltransferase family 4 protein [Patescibacteria group bacterium]